MISRSKRRPICILDECPARRPTDKQGQHQSQGCVADRTCLLLPDVIKPHDLVKVWRILANKEECNFALRGDAPQRGQCGG